MNKFLVIAALIFGSLTLQAAEDHKRDAGTEVVRADCASDLKEYSALHKLCQGIHRSEDQGRCYAHGNNAVAGGKRGLNVAMEACAYRTSEGGSPFSNGECWESATVAWPEDEILRAAVAHCKPKKSGSATRFFATGISQTGYLRCYNEKISELRKTN